METSAVIRAPKVCRGERDQKELAGEKVDQPKRRNGGVKKTREEKQEEGKKRRKKKIWGQKKRNWDEPIFELRLRRKGAKEKPRRALHRKGNGKQGEGKEEDWRLRLNGWVL